VPKTLVTGATGFIGSHLVRALGERGDELKLLLRRSSRDEHLADVEFSRATGDVLDRRTLKRAMREVERVFHCAGTTSLRRQDRQRVFRLNVEGTHNVVAAAAEAGVERVVHTSSIAAIGPAAAGKAVDEEHPFDAGVMGIAYVNSKHESEVEALRFAAQGLDVVIVNPTFVLGPDAPSGTSMALVRRFLLRQIPAYVDGALNIVDVRDVADGLLLADRKGRSGNRYILGGRNFTLQRLFADLARIAGVPPPPLRLPTPLARAGAEFADLTGLPLPVSSDEIRSGLLWWTARNTKAKRELGFNPRPHEETLEDAVRWQASTLGDRIETRPTSAYELPLRAAGRALRLGERILGR
jgi:dihydroflavonol-4-reductase